MKTVCSLPQGGKHRSELPPKANWYEFIEAFVHKDDFAEENNNDRMEVVI